MAAGNDIVLFALSTCNACRKTKDILDRNSVEYVCADLDTMDIDSSNKLLEKMREYNHRETFPTLVIDRGEKVVIGYREEEINAALELS